LIQRSSLETVKDIILSCGRFFLTTHVNPDGDGLGSELALARFLRKLGKHAEIGNHNRTPDNYEFLDPEKEIVSFEPQRDAGRILGADVILILDTNQPDRLRSLEPAVRESKAAKIVIDHHLDATPFADQYLLDEDATSTGEIVYRLLASINADLIDKDIAGALYTAIMTDTGSFRFPRTDPEVHAITADLIRRGADPMELYSGVYENWSLGRMRLLGEVLTSMKTAYDGKLAYLVCTQKMFQDTGTTEIETDNFTTYPMSVKGVVVGILINELPNGVKISFRSKGEIPINQLAKEFGGGGHKNAAGARVHDVSLDETVANVIQKASSYVSK
jgi:phosphoesterase RecJ-like protein